MGKIINIIDHIISDDVFDFIKKRATFTLSDRQEEIINISIGNYINNNEDWYLEEIKTNISHDLNEAHIVFIEIHLNEFMNLFLLALQKLYNYNIEESI